MATQTKAKTKSVKSAPRAPKKQREAQAAPKKSAKIDPQNLEAIRLLREWDNFTPEEIQEQKETWEFLKKALDEDRLSPNRPHFPSNGDDSP